MLISGAPSSETPCKTPVIYPIKITENSFKKGTYAIFHVLGSLSNTAYIAHVRSKDSGRVGLDFPINSEVLHIVDIYENSPWPEAQLADQNGVFYYKKAPSYEELLAYLEKLKK